MFPLYIIMIFTVYSMNCPKAMPFIRREGGGCLVPKKGQAELYIKTLGNFQVSRGGF